MHCVDSTPAPPRSLSSRPLLPLPVLFRPHGHTRRPRIGLEFDLRRVPGGRVRRHVPRWRLHTSGVELVSPRKFPSNA